MEIKDWISIGAATISLVALLISLINRQRDLTRAEAYQIRTRVWDILNGEPGFRTISALSESDGKTETRRSLLERTASQLKLAGAPELGEKLSTLLKSPWPTPSPDPRDGFLKSASKFMEPT
jgi:hypothetical protein